MNSFEHILVGTDLSEESNHAIRTGIGHCVASGQRLHVVHAIPESVRFAAGAQASTQREQIQHEVEKRIRSLAESMGAETAASLELSIYARYGRPDRVICDVAAETGPDLIVLGRHGRHVLEHLFLGSTTAKIARATSVPLLITRASNAISDRYKSVLAAVDLGDLSPKVLKIAGEFAKNAGAKLHVLHVYESIGLYEYTSLTPNVPTSRYDKDMADSAREGLDNLIDEASISALWPASYVRPGLPAGEILYQSEKMRIDLIVVGSHRRKGLDRFLLGNTADRIMRRASCDVLVVKGDDADHEGDD